MCLERGSYLYVCNGENLKEWNRKERTTGIVLGISEAVEEGDYVYYANTRGEIVRVNVFTYEQSIVD